MIPITISSIELTNVQKHAYLKLDFSDGVNTIYGKSGIGKSVCVRAIKWILYNEPKGDTIRRDDTKKTTVKITLSNNITIERIKSNSINKYIITPGKTEKEDVFENVGKEVPDRVLEVAQISSTKIAGESVILNIADQITMPFLLDKTASYRMKMFNELTGNEILDKTIQSFNKDNMKISKENKIFEEDLNEKQLQEKTLNEKVDNYKKKILELQELQNKLSDVYDNYKLLKETKLEYDLSIENIESIKLEIEEIKILDIEVINDIEQDIQDYNELSFLNDELKATTSKINHIKQNMPEIVDTKDIELLDDDVHSYNIISELDKRLKSLNEKIKLIEQKIPKVKRFNFDELQKKIEGYDTLKESEIIYKNNTNKIQRIERNCVVLTDDIERFKKEYKKMVKDLKICPVCGGDVNDDKLDKCLGV